MDQVNAEYVWMDGEYVPWDDASVHVTTHALHYGTGVFEGIRSYNRLIFKLKEHIDRLFESAHSIMLEIPMSKEQMIEAVIQTLSENKLDDAYIRLVVTRGEGDLGLDPRKCKGNATVIIIADKIVLYPDKLYKKGLEIITVPTVRNVPEAVNPQIKSLNYLNNILAKIEANDAGVAEALMLSCDGFVAECTADNVFIVSHGKVLTPSVDADILHGIPRGVVIELASQHNIPLEETQLRLDDVYAADECFLTGTAAEVVPVTKVDDKTIGAGKPGPITKRLMGSFHEYVQKQT